MFFYVYTKLYFPRFSSKRYESQIQNILSSEAALNWDKDKYQALLRLKNHASAINENLHQLKKLNEDAYNILRLERLIDEIFEQAVKTIGFSPAQYSNKLPNLYSLVKNDLNQSKISDKILAAGNMICHLMLASCAVFLAIASMAELAATLSIGMAFLMIGVFICSTLLTAITVYSAYVEIRNIFDLQLAEIEEGIDALLSITTTRETTLNNISKATKESANESFDDINSTTQMKNR